MKIAVMFARLGPYHMARLEHAGAYVHKRGHSLIAVETARWDSTYAWNEVDGASHFQRITLFPDRDGDQIPGRSVKRAVREALDRQQPDVVALPGWVVPEALGGLAWCRKQNAASILMSESSRHDFTRHPWKEFFKKQVVKQFDAALVGGSLHAEYAHQLGMCSERILQGYDVVDNDYFRIESDRVREHAQQRRVEYQLPTSYFLASGRFIAKKNFLGLLDAYAAYRARAPGTPWQLVLSGDGPMRDSIDARIQSLGIREAVHLPGFVQYEELPVYYGLADAFIMPSTTEQWGLVVNEAMASGLPVIVSDRCGCSMDLVAQGKNGYTYSPHDTDALSALMIEMAHGSADRQAMSAASRHGINYWSPQVFAESLWHAARVAVETRRSKGPDKKNRERFAGPSARQLLQGTRIREACGQLRTWETTSESVQVHHQLSALQLQWTEAVMNVPYYRNLVANGDAPKRIESFEHYRESVPILTRETIIENPSAFRRSHPPDRVMTTSGSSGVPLSFGAWNREALAHSGLNQWMGRLRNGMQPGDRIFLLWGQSQLLGTGLSGRLKRLHRFTKDWALGVHRADSYDLGVAASHRYFDALRRYQPGVVIGFAASLDLWARHNLEESRRADDLGIRLCVACSEIFPRQDSRETLKQFLGCPVVMEYGGLEFGVCAYEIHDRGEYRTFWRTHYFETESGATDGPIIVSGLTERYLPLFRYRNGDACAGATHSDEGQVTAFQSILGRTHDVDLYRMHDGRELDYNSVSHCISGEPIDFIQLVSDDQGLRFRFAARELPPSVEDRIRLRLKRLHPDLEHCPFEVAEDVATTPAGKRRWLIRE